MKRLNFSGLLLFFPLFIFSQEINDSILKSQLESYWDTANNLVSPYVLKYNVKGKEVVLFGTDHSIRDPGNQMFTNLEREIKELSPTLILVERYSSISNSKSESIINSGDIGFCTFIGLQKDIQVESWDTKWSDIYNELKTKFSSDEIYAVTLSIPVYLFPYSGHKTYETFFDELVSSLEGLGYPFKPEQKNPQYFYQAFKKQFEHKFEFSSIEEYYAYLEKNAVYNKIFSSLEQLRDLHLFQLLKSRLSKHDKIFVQAGAMHLGSINQFLAKFLEEQSFLRFDSSLGNINLSHGIMFTDDNLKFNKKIYTKHDKKIILLGTTHSVNNPSDSTYKNIELEINDTKPDIVLTQGYDPIYSTKAETISLSADVGFCRYLAVNKGIKINSWEPSWSDVYDQLFKKYNKDDIFFSIICWSLLRYHNNIVIYPSMEEDFDELKSGLISKGFPFQPYQNYLAFLSLYRRYNPDSFWSNTYKVSMESIQKTLNKNFNNILNDMHVIRLNHILRILRKYLKTSDTIILQADIEYIQGIEKLLRNKNMTGIFKLIDSIYNNKPTS